MVRTLLVLCALAVGCSEEANYQGAGPKVKSPKTASAAKGEDVGNGKKPNAASAERVAEKLFNVAILTKSVQCLFCHMKIEGDVGGIQFPADAQMHNRAGEGLRILGTLYATNTVPSKLAKSPQAKNVRDNYKNSELKIFPTTVSSSGRVTFPVVKPELLDGKTKGTIKFGGKSITDSYKGDLNILDEGSPIEINGEIYVDGTVIIGGKYKGIGTIYAKNIFVVRDLQAQNSPFPFGTDAAVGKEKGKKAIEAKSDGLYLFALGQITVGYPDEKLLEDQNWKHKEPVPNPHTKQQPSDSIEEYIALAKPKTCMPARQPSNYQKVIVNRVDAFLYASDYLLWRTCNGFELNGGFVAPDVALLNAGDADGMGRDTEPKNAVRYDYRLRAGVKAFSVLKEFFEQE